jgi:hypothetical protein
MALTIGTGVGYLLKPETQKPKNGIELPKTVQKYIDFSFEIVGDGSTVTKIKNKMSGTEYRITLAGDSPWCFISEEILNSNINPVDSLIVIDGKFNEDNEYFFDYFRSLIDQEEIGTPLGSPSERDQDLNLDLRSSLPKHKKNELPSYFTVDHTDNGIYIKNEKTKSQYHYNEYPAPNSENTQFTENFFNEDNSVVHDETVLATGFYGEIVDGTHKFKSLYGQCGQIDLPSSLLSENSLEDIQKKYCVYHTPEQRLIDAGLQK